MTAGLGLYVHLPWCVSKCPYCDFNSHPLRGALPQAQYVRALLEDLECEAPRLQGRCVSSIFFGGGTPSLFSGEAIDALLSGIAERVCVERDAEITLEANPGSADRARFAAYRAAGVNRLSLGAQSFSADKLVRLGRAHGPAEILAAVRAAREAGFVDFNLDLMYGLPEQSPAQALADLEAALALSPTHLSHYQLTLEPNTRFHHDPPPLPDEDQAWEMQQACEQRLRRDGFERYEVSAWARPGRRCRHNVNYWRFGDYVGIGAGAHGKLSTADGIRRRIKLPHPGAYLQGRDGPARLLRESVVAPQEARFEYLLNALRLTEGFTLAALEAAVGATAAPLLAPLREAQQRGLLEERHPGCWRTTPLGLRFLDSVLLEFLPDPQSTGAAEGATAAVYAQAGRER